MKLNIRTFLQCLLLCHAHRVHCVLHQSTISSSYRHPVRKFAALFVLSVIGRLPRNLEKFMQYAISYSIYNIHEHSIYNDEFIQMIIFINCIYKRSAIGVFLFYLKFFF